MTSVYCHDSAMTRGKKGVFEMFLRKLPQNRLFDGSWAGSDDTISAAFSI